MTTHEVGNVNNFKNVMLQMLYASNCEDMDETNL